MRPSVFELKTMWISVLSTGLRTKASGARPNLSCNRRAHSGWAGASTESAISRMLQHGSRDFAFSHDDGGGADPAQIIDLHVEMRARDDLDRGVFHAGAQDDLTHLECFGNGDQQ